MPQDVSGKFLGQRRFVALVVLLRKATKHTDIVMRRLGAAVPLQKQEIGVALNNDRIYTFSVVPHPQKRLIDLLTHVDSTYAAFGLGCGNVVALSLIRSAHSCVSEISRCQWGSFRWGLLSAYA